MDTGLGNLEPISEKKFEEVEGKKVTGIFKQGETVEIKGSKFRVAYITKDGIQLRILPQQ